MKGTSLIAQLQAHVAAHCDLECLARGGGNDTVDATGVEQRYATIKSGGLMVSPERRNFAPNGLLPPVGLELSSAREHEFRGQGQPRRLGRRAGTTGCDQRRAAAGHFFAACAGCGLLQRARRDARKRANRDEALSAIVNERIRQMFYADDIPPEMQERMEARHMEATRVATPGRRSKLLLNSEDCPGGGIGRRTWFRSMRRKVWGFESLPGHHVKRLNGPSQGAVCPSGVDGLA